jgi:hypothetical protein
VLWCLNGQWKIKTSFRINPINDFIEMYTHVLEDSIKMVEGNKIGKSGLASRGPA